MRSKPPEQTVKPKPFKVGQQVTTQTGNGRWEGEVVSMVAEVPDGLIVRWDHLNGEAVTPVQRRSPWAKVSAVSSASKTSADRTERESAWWLEND